ncbi:T9SS type A sorting domain-containing protein [Lewinella sp. LCG006]|uniref:T9SS type A sorting domain-containing protein n=1 Tax=Lewinella sp. LCG006 TaxID=3231911 RepID=UPI00346138B1
MKQVYLLLLLFAFAIGNTQSLPFDFENGITTADFEDFDGGTATVIPNPQMSGINTSATVAQIVRNGGAVFAGSKILLAENLDFSTLNTLSMKVFTTAPVGTTVKFKLEGVGAAERDVQTTVSNEWETLTWDFTGTPANFNYLVFMFDFGNVGDGSANSTFLFDDVEQLFGGAQLDLPVTFEDPDVNYTLTDFEGNQSFIVTDPTDPSNTVGEILKDNLAGSSAGTTIGTPGGFATNIPLSLTDSKMTVRVWSPDAGIPVRLKVEDSNDPTRTCETQTNTTVAGEWETLEFDFANEATGTAALSFGLGLGWTYNKASIFFNFGTTGAAAGTKTYYFDDVAFDGDISGTSDYALEGLKVFPNPATDQWNISAENALIHSVEVFDIQGKLMLVLRPDSPTASINAANLATGIYVAKIATASGVGVIRLVKE